MGKFVPGSDDGDSMEEEVDQNKKIVPGVKRVRIKKPKRPKGPSEEPNVQHVVRGKNLLLSTNQKLKIKSAMALKKLSKANPSVLREFQTRKKEELKQVLDNKAKKDTIIDNKKLTQGQRKREKKKNMTMKKKDFQEYQQTEATTTKGGHEKRDKKGTFNMMQIESTLDNIDSTILNEKQIGHNQNPMIKQKNDASMNEITRISSIAKMKAYSQNPLAALKTHITNNQKQENKF